MPDERIPAIKVLLLPKDTNALGTIFGGVILSSPFEAFNRYEAEIGLPKDFIRGLNARNGDTNAWAKMERSEVSLEGFVALFEEEAREQGHKLDWARGYPLRAHPERNR